MVRRGLLGPQGVLAILAALLLALPASATASHSMTELLTVGPTGGQGPFDAVYRASNEDGTREIFETSEGLVASDTDGKLDVYERVGTTTTSLISTGSTGGNGAFPATWRFTSKDGLRTFFTTFERLVAGDTDDRMDVYERAGGVTTLMSIGPTGGNGNTEFLHDADIRGISNDGLHIFFETFEQLTSQDTDSSYDTYERFGGTTSLASIGPTGGNGAVPTEFSGNSADGSKVWFFTTEQLTSQDTDSQQDVYERAGGTTTSLVSTAAGSGNGAFSADWKGATPDGSHVYFATSEPLLPADADAGGLDVYDRSGGTTTLVSVGVNGTDDAVFAGATSDGSRAWFQTREPINPNDTDSTCPDEQDPPNFNRRCVDVYERSSGTTTWISTGPTETNGPHGATWKAASPDGSTVIFQTSEPVTATDNECPANPPGCLQQVDVFQRTGGTVTQLSLGPAGGNGNFQSLFGGASDDLSRVFFSTFETLVSADQDGNWGDVYERSGGATTLISTGPGATNGPNPAFFLEASKDGSRVYVETDEPLHPNDVDGGMLDTYLVSIPTGYPRPQGAVQTGLPLVVAYTQCPPGSTNRTHAGGLSFPSCNPAQQASNWLTVGTNDANGFGPQSNGRVKITVCPSGTTAAGACSTPTGMSAPDVRLEMAATDIRCRVGGPSQSLCQGGALSDYTGELRGALQLRITDRHNSTTPGGTGDSATVQDLSIPFTAQCSANPAGANALAIGGSCSVITRVNAVMPGAVPAGKRGNWELGQFSVADGGPDGTAATADNNTFLKQGVFVP